MVSGLIIALILVAGLSPLLWRFYLQQSWSLTRGKVTVNTERWSRGGHCWDPSVEFFAQGEQHVFVANIWQIHGASPRYKVGETVDVLYSPANPSRAIIGVWSDYVISTAIIEIIALLLISHPPKFPEP